MRRNSLPRLSVVIPTYNNARQLHATLNGLCGQTLAADEFDVIIIDDGSVPAAEWAIADHRETLAITYIWQKNQGRSKVRNRGVAEATADVLLFLDADSYPHPDLLRRHLAFHDRRDGRPGVLMGRRYDIDWAAADAIRRGEIPRPPLVGEYRDDVRDLRLSAAHQRRDLVRVPWLAGFTHNLSLPRATFLAVGGFDENMTGWGLEDVELCYRVFHHLGATPDLFAFGDDAIVYHQPQCHDLGGQQPEITNNMVYAVDKHLRYDMELLMTASVGTFAAVQRRILFCMDGFEAAEKHGLGRVEAVPADADWLPADRPGLVVGYGAADLALPPESVTFDHGAPPTTTNLHLVGLRQPFADGRFATVASVDMWRLFTPDDLMGFLVEAFRVAERVDLIATRTDLAALDVFPAPFAADLDYVAELLRAGCSVAELPVSSGRHFRLTRRDRTAAG